MKSTQPPIRYKGKAKSLCLTDNPSRLIMHFRDDISAFNGKKQASLPGKGATNHRFNTLMMQHLEMYRIPTHFEDSVGEQQALVKRLEMIPLECVVRNVSAGSLCRRLGMKPKLKLTPPIIEFYLKDDALDDPMVNTDHIESMGLATRETWEEIQHQSLTINSHLVPLFLKANLLLVDYKLEFGFYKGEILLGDEITPDNCRIWCMDTHESLDKDRFRNDLDLVVEMYQRALDQLEMALYY